MAKGYTTAKLVAEELGRQLTAPQLDQVADLVGEAEAFIDHETQRSWLVASPITDELHTATGPVVYLNNKPVTAITSVKSRPLSIGGADTTLTAGSDYELVDAANGALLIRGYGSTFDVVTDTLPHGSLLKVTYTTTSPLPGLVQRVATLIVAHWMLPRLEPDRQGLKAYSVGGELSVTMHDKREIPDEALRLLRSLEAVVFA